MRSVSRIILIPLITSLAVLLLAAAPSASEHAVSIKDMKFDPDTVNIKVGDTVKWTNNDDRDHDVASSDGSFKSENLRPGSSFSFKFTKPGKFEYSCSYRPRMKGTIVVAAAGK